MDGNDFLYLINATKSDNVDDGIDRNYAGNREAEDYLEDDEWDPVDLWWDIQDDIVNRAKTFTVTLSDQIDRAPATAKNMFASLADGSVVLETTVADNGTVTVYFDYTDGYEAAYRPIITMTKANGDTYPITNASWNTTDGVWEITVTEDIHIDVIGASQYATYDITYKWAHDDSVIDTDQYTYDPANAFTLAELPDAGAAYTVTGWYTSAECTDDPVVTSLAAGTYGDKTFYAKRTSTTGDIVLQYMRADGTVADTAYQYKITQGSKVKFQVEPVQGYTGVMYDGVYRTPGTVIEVTKDAEALQVVPVTLVNQRNLSVVIVGHETSNWSMGTHTPATLNVASATDEFDVSKLVATYIGSGNAVDVWRYFELNVSGAEFVASDNYNEITATQVNSKAIKGGANEEFALANLKLTKVSGAVTITVTPHVAEASVNLQLFGQWSLSANPGTVAFAPGFDNTTTIKVTATNSNWLDPNPRYANIQSVTGVGTDGGAVFANGDDVVEIPVTVTNGGTFDVTLTNVTGNVTINFGFYDTQAKAEAALPTP